MVLLELLIVSHLASAITSHTHPCPLQPLASPYSLNTPHSRPVHRLPVFLEYPLSPFTRMNLTSTVSLCFSSPSAPICSSSDCLSLGRRFSFLCCCSTTPILITGRITVHWKYLFPLLQEALKSEGAILKLRVTAQNPVQHLAHSTLCSSDE